MKRLILITILLISFNAFAGKEQQAEKLKAEFTGNKCIIGIQTTIVAKLNDTEYEALTHKPMYLTKWLTGAGYPETTRVIYIPLKKLAKDGAIGDIVVQFTGTKKIMKGNGFEETIQVLKESEVCLNIKKKIDSL